MASGRCRSCGGDLPADARFCPRCGTGLDGVPLLPLLDAEEQPAPAGADGQGRRASKGMRTVLLLAAGVVVLLLGLSAFAGGDDDTEDDADEQAADDGDDSTSDRDETSSRSSSTSTSTTVVDVLPDGGDPAVAGAVALVASDGAIVLADLGTGRQVEVPGPGGEVGGLSVHGGLILATDGSGGSFAFGVDRSESWSAVDVGLDPSYRTESDDSLLILDDDTVGVLDEAGVLSTWDLPFAQAWSVRGRVGDEIVINSHDGVFLVRADGTARRMSHGTALGTNGREVVVVSCDDALRCWPVLMAADGAVVSTLPPIPDGYVIGSATVSPDGTEVLLEGHRWDEGGLDRHVFRAEADGWSTSSIGSSWGISGAVWVPDTGTAVWWQPDTLTIMAISAGGDPVRLRLSAPGQAGWARVAVATVDVLPEAWRAELAG